MKRKLYVHVGLPKTGSTAIQIFCAKNADLLKKKGVLYPDFENSFEENIHTGESFGNARPLLLLLDQIKINQANACNLINEWFADLNQVAAETDCSVVILSSEFFSLIENSAWTILNECVALYFDILIIGVKREPYSWFFAGWMQGVKKHGSAVWFQDVDVNVSLEPLLAEKYIKNIFPDRYLFLSYERHQQNIVKGFFGEIGLAQCYSDMFDEVKRVNVSISCEQLQIFLLINKSSHQDYLLSRTMATSVLRDKNDEPCFLYCPNMHEKVNAYIVKNKLDYTWTDYSAYKPTISYQDWANTINLKYPQLQTALKSIIYFYQTQMLALVSSVHEKVSFYRNSPFISQLPSDFNGHTYLLLNQDVLFADIDPYEHYSKFGQFERRIIQWPNLDVNDYQLADFNSIQLARS